MSETEDQSYGLPEVNWPTGHTIPHYPRVCASFSERTPLLRYEISSRMRHKSQVKPFLVADATMLHIYDGWETKHGRWQDIHIEDEGDYVSIYFTQEHARTGIRLPQRITRALILIQQRRLMELEHNGVDTVPMSPLKRQTAWAWGAFGVSMLSVIMGAIGMSSVLNNMGSGITSLIIIAAAAGILVITATLITILNNARGYQIDEWGLYQLGGNGLMEAYSWSRLQRLSVMPFWTRLKFIDSENPDHPQHERWTCLWNYGGDVLSNDIGMKMLDHEQALARHDWDEAGWINDYKSVFGPIIHGGSDQSTHILEGVFKRSESWQLETFKPDSNATAKNATEDEASHSIKSEHTFHKWVKQHQYRGTTEMRWPKDRINVRYPLSSDDLNARCGLLRYTHMQAGADENQERYSLIADPGMLHILFRGMHLRGRWQDIALRQARPGMMTIQWHASGKEESFAMPEHVYQFVLSIQSHRRKELREIEPWLLNQDVMSSGSLFQAITLVLIWTLVPGLMILLFIYMGEIELFELQYLLTCCMVPIYLIIALLLSVKVSGPKMHYQMDDWGLYIYDHKCLVQDIPWSLVTHIKSRGLSAHLYYRDHEPYADTLDSKPTEEERDGLVHMIKLPHFLGENATQLLGYSQNMTPEKARRHTFNAKLWRVFYEEHIEPALNPIDQASTDDDDGV